MHGGRGTLIKLYSRKKNANLKTNFLLIEFPLNHVLNYSL